MIDHTSIEGRMHQNRKATVLITEHFGIGEDDECMRRIQLTL